MGGHFAAIASGMKTRPPLSGTLRVPAACPCRGYATRLPGAGTSCRLEGGSSAGGSSGNVRSQVLSAALQRRAMCGQERVWACLDLVNLPQKLLLTTPSANGLKIGTLQVRQLMLNKSAPKYYSDFPAVVGCMDVQKTLTKQKFWRFSAV